MDMFPDNISIVMYNDLEFAKRNDFCGKKRMEEGKK
jgi:hypothetical protein